MSMHSENVLPIEQHRAGGLVRSERTIGAILLEEGKLTQREIEKVLERQRQDKVRFGEAAVRLGFITEDDVRFALAKQYDMPHFTPSSEGPSRELVAAFAPFHPRTEEMRALRTAWGAQLAPALSRITGHAVSTADLRAYAYRVGHYLLPHADHQDGLERKLAFAYYLPSPEPPIGGELELFQCRAVDGELVEIASAKIIEARANRIAIFDVSDVSLHQVREVLGGLRLSLSGWFYP